MSESYFVRVEENQPTAEVVGATECEGLRTALISTVFTGKIDVQELSEGKSS